MAARVAYSPVLQKRLAELRAALDTGDWMLPASDWDEDMNNYEGFRQPFDTTQLNVDTALAVSDPANPGKATDKVVGPAQVDLLDSLRRATLFRHSYDWARCQVLAEGRDKAQAQPQGPLENSIASYLQAMLKQGLGEDSA